MLWRERGWVGVWAHNGNLDIPIKLNLPRVDHTIPLYNVSIVLNGNGIWGMSMRQGVGE